MAKKKTTPAVIKKETELRAMLKVEFLEAYSATMFNISEAIKMVPGLNSRTTVYSWQKTDPAFANEMILAREELKDFAESQLIVLARGIPKVTKGTGKLIGWTERPDPASVIFMNKALNKDRGYVERVEHEHTRKESRIDLNRLTKKEREEWYILLEKATIPEEEEGITEVEIVQ
jgi:hypothetical protein